MAKLIECAWKNNGFTKLLGSNSLILQQFSTSHILIII